MNDDYDIDPDFELEQLENEIRSLQEADEEEDDDLADFEALLAEDEFDPAWMRTAVLKKNSLIALLCIKSAPRGAAICRVDPREDRPAVQLYADPEKAFEWFRKSLRTSRKNGWEVVYDGLPLRG